MMHMAVRHTNADGIFTKASHPPRLFVPGMDGPPLKPETAGLADATVKQLSTLILLENLMIVTELFWQVTTYCILDKL